MSKFIPGKMNGLLFEGSIVFIDNYYTSVPLGEELLENNTFMCKKMW